MAHNGVQQNLLNRGAYAYPPGIAVLDGGRWNFDENFATGIVLRIRACYSEHGYQIGVGVLLAPAFHFLLETIMTIDKDNDIAGRDAGGRLATVGLTVGKRSLAVIPGEREA